MYFVDMHASRPGEIREDVDGGGQQLIFFLRVDMPCLGKAFFFIKEEINENYKTPLRECARSRDSARLRTRVLS